MNLKQRAVVFLACFIALSATAIEVGDPAPGITTVDQDGKTWRLSEHLGEHYLVIYFYPAAMTGGCTKQACSYRDYRKDGASKFDVVGISGDPAENLKWFRQEEHINFTLLSDADGSIATDFGVPVKKGERSITRTVGGRDVQLNRAVTAERWTFIIDPKGTVVYRADRVKPVEDLQQVLAFLAKKES